MSIYSSSSYLGEYIPMLPSDRTKCILIANIIILQCIAVVIGASSILLCFWTPAQSTLDFDKLARIMYLFDYHACGYQLKIAKSINNLHFGNDTKGLDILPITWQHPVHSVSTRLTIKTRRYIELSLTLHLLWLLLAVVTRCFSKRSVHLRSLKLVLAIFFYSCIFMLLFDISMALVYISHIKQSLTKGMILRYSGWSSTLKLQSYDDFGGWLPLIASCCWLRGILFFFLNIYWTRLLKQIRRKIRRREIKKKYANDQYMLIPEPRPMYFGLNVLVYHDMEHRPTHFQIRN